MAKIIIDADKDKFRLGIKELRAYKDLFLLLAYRDFRVRYAQTFMGLAWAVMQPLVTLVILTIVFGKVAKIDTESIPYPLFAISGLSIWSYFSFVMSQSGSSIIGAQEMIKKIYFPRLIIPLSKTLVGLVDLIIGIIFIIGLCIYFGYMPSGNLVYLPLFFFMGILSAVGIGIWLSALTIRYRDFQHVIPFAVQVGLYATPIAYSSKEIIENIPEWAGVLYFLNPMAGVVEGVRWSLFDTTFMWNLSSISFLCALIVFISGIWYFRQVERFMADIV